MSACATGTGGCLSVFGINTTVGVEHARPILLMCRNYCRLLEGSSMLDPYNEHHPETGYASDLAVDSDTTGHIRLCWRRTLDVYLVDGTYELFRHYYALPSARDQDGREVAAVRGVLASVLGMIKGGATHIAVATDHVIESFRNGLWAGYKTSEGIEPDLLAQLPLLEDGLPPRSA